MQRRLGSEFGIKIDTLDNPGWSVSIDLIETIYEKKLFKEIDIQKSPDKWMQCSLKNDVFYGARGPKNLIGILKTFFD